MGNVMQQPILCFEDVDAVLSKSRPGIAQHLTQPHLKNPPARQKAALKRKFQFTTVVLSMPGTVIPIAVLIDPEQSTDKAERGGKHTFQVELGAVGEVPACSVLDTML